MIAVLAPLSRSLLEHVGTADAAERPKVPSNGVSIMPPCIHKGKCDRGRGGGKAQTIGRLYCDSFLYTEEKFFGGVAVYQ